MIVMRYHSDCHTPHHSDLRIYDRVTHDDAFAYDDSYDYDYGVPNELCGAYIECGRCHKILYSGRNTKMVELYIKLINKPPFVVDAALYGFLHDEEAAEWRGGDDRWRLETSG